MRFEKDLHLEECRQDLEITRAKAHKHTELRNKDILCETEGVKTILTVPSFLCNVTEERKRGTREEQRDSK